jgi:predicted lactoylglutathione lyase
MSIPFHSLVPLVHVRSVPVSTAFYEKLGFRVVSSHKEETESEISMYVPDVEAKHREIVAARTAT